jgi:hypothetical protein
MDKSAVTCGMILQKTDETTAKKTSPCIIY